MKPIPFLNGIRGIAAIMVVFAHIGCFWGEVCVDVFFVLSSFLLTTNLYERYLQYIKAQRTLFDWFIMLVVYFIKRFARIYPLLIALGLYLATLVPEVREKAYHIPKDYAFSLWNMIRFDTKFFVLWTLPVEFHYYMIIPLIVFAYTITPSKYLRWAGLTYIVYRSVLDGFNAPVLRRAFYPFQHHQWVFLVGSVIAFLYVDLQASFDFSKLNKSIKAKLDTLSTILVIYIVMIAWNSDLFAFLFWKEKPHGFYYPYSAWAISLVILKEALIPGDVADFFSANFFQFLGKISFSIYLLHAFPLRMWTPGSLPIKEVCFVPFMTIMISIPSFYLIEKPCIDATNHFCKHLQESLEQGTSQRMYLYKVWDYLESRPWYQKLRLYTRVKSTSEENDKIV